MDKYVQNIYRELIYSLSNFIPIDIDSINFSLIYYEEYILYSILEPYLESKKTGNIILFSYNKHKLIINLENEKIHGFPAIVFIDNADNIMSMYYFNKGYISDLQCCPACIQYNYTDIILMYNSVYRIYAKEPIIIRLNKINILSLHWNCDINDIPVEHYRYSRYQSLSVRLIDDQPMNIIYSNIFLNYCEENELLDCEDINFNMEYDKYTYNTLFRSNNIMNEKNIEKIRVTQLELTDEEELINSFDNISFNSS